MAAQLWLEFSSMTSDMSIGLTYDDAPAAIEWLCRVFGFKQRLVVPGPDGTVIHSELTFGNAVVMVSSPKPEYCRVGPRSLTGTSQTVCVFTDDPDSHYEHAKTNGAEVVQEIADANFGCRGYMVRDLEGHGWFFSNYRPGEHWSD